MEEKSKQRHYRRCYKFGKLRFYITWNYRLRNSQLRDNDENERKYLKSFKKSRYEMNGGKCEICGKRIDKLCHSQVHHIIPYWKLTEEQKHDERNMTLLCPTCHKEIHLNPFLNGRMITMKCNELGLNVNEMYDLAEF